MVNPFAEIKWHPDRAERRRFATSLVIGFPCLGLLFLLIGVWRTGVWNFFAPSLVAGIGAAVGALLWAWPAIARPFYLAWYLVGGAIGFVVGNLVLTAVFYLVITPIGLIRRITRRTPVRRRPDPAAATYWRDASPATTARDAFRQF